jgi:RNase adaptor protein for sRNA GlmZ degradation
MTISPSSPILTVEITSFSYKAPLPPTLFSWDEGRHGGGFTFDCRALPNPGREAQFAMATGLDQSVQEYLLALPAVHEFKNHAFGLVAASVEVYLSRGFTFLSVGFGCTGGQHRSVFMAHSLANFLLEKFRDRIHIVVDHVNLKAKGLLP